MVARPKRRFSMHLGATDFFSWFVVLSLAAVHKDVRPFQKVLFFCTALADFGVRDVVESAKSLNAITGNVSQAVCR